MESKLRGGFAFGAPIPVKEDDGLPDSDDEPYQPEVYTDLEPYWRAWTAIENQREGCGPVRTEAIASYLDIAGVTGRDRVAYLDILQVLDVEACGFLAAEMKQQQAAARARARMR